MTPPSSEAAGRVAYDAGRDSLEAAAQPHREFRVVRADQWPHDALSWTSPREKGRLRRAWRLAVVRRYNRHRRLLLLGWALHALSAREGWCFATDPHLVEETGLRLNNLQSALTKFSREGVIVRVHVRENGTYRRRIYLGNGVVLAERTDTPHDKGYSTPHDGRPDTPHGEGREGTLRPNRSGRRRCTMREAARADAERRDARARGEVANFWTEGDD